MNRGFCVALTGTAFTLGVIVGILFPLYIISSNPGGVSADDAGAAPWRSEEEVAFAATTVKEEFDPPLSDSNNGRMLDRHHSNGWSLIGSKINTLPALLSSQSRPPSGWEGEVVAGRNEKFGLQPPLTLDSKRRMPAVEDKRSPPPSLDKIPESLRLTTTDLPFPYTTREKLVAKFANSDKNRTNNNNAIPSFLKRGNTKMSSQLAMSGYSFGDVISDGIFWSRRIEGLVPEGFTDDDLASWRSFAQRAQIVKLTEGCGRMQNRLIMFDSGNKSCCRYRQNSDQIQGEIFSFYLARLLGVRNLPPATLSIVHGKEWQWAPVRSQINLAQWCETKPVVLTKYVDELTPAYIPKCFRGSDRRLSPTVPDLANYTKNELTELVQWSDLIILDYLTANLDRVVNNMYNRQWNAQMMDSPAHNLARVKETGLLIFLDNESGLLHGYRLLEKYEPYHRSLLESLCIFRERTANVISRLVRQGNIGELLAQLFRTNHSEIQDWLQLLPEKSVKTLKERLATVHSHIQNCSSKFRN